MSRSIALVLAGGSGKRMGQDLPKQLLKLRGREVLVHALLAFEKSRVDEIILVSKEEYTQEVFRLAQEHGIEKLSTVVMGGAERYLSVYNALSYVEIGEDDIVLIHDGARPLISSAKINMLLDMMREKAAAALAVPAKDTLRMTDGAGHFVSEIDRSKVYQMQTPQAFRAALLKEAYDKLMEEEALQQGITDDVMVVERCLGISAALCPGDYSNIKITTPEDMVMAEALLTYLEKEEGRKENE